MEKKVCFKETFPFPGRAPGGFFEGLINYVVSTNALCQHCRLTVGIMVLLAPIGWCRTFHIRNSTESYRKLLKTKKKQVSCLGMFLIVFQ